VCERSARSLKGKLAASRARQRNRAQDSTSRALDVRYRFLSESDDGVLAFATSLARLKNSLELGLLGSVFKGTDPIRRETYETLAESGERSFQLGTRAERISLRSPVPAN